MSYKASDVYRTAFLTVDGTLDSNNSQLYFRPLQYPLQPVSGNFYSLSPAQQTDPSLRINQFSSNGTLQSYGYLYDTQFNPIPPGAYLLVAVGQGANPIIYSNDGSIWLESANGATIFSGGYCTAIAYNGYIWIATGSAGAASTLAYSSNGTDWIASASARTLLASARTIVTSGPLSIVGGPVTSGISVIYSTDGISWNSLVQASNYLTTACLAAAWSGSTWVLGGSGTETLIYSYDGISWYPSHNGNTIFSQCNSVAWSGSRWVAGGSGANTIAYSTDGINWIASTPVKLLGTASNAVAWSGSQWIAGGTDPSNNTLVYSEDGIAWNDAVDVSGYFTACQATAWTRNAWLAGGTGTESMLISYDGINWAPVTVVKSLLTTCYGIAVNRVLPNVAIPERLVVTYPSNPLDLIGGTNVGGVGSILSSSTDGITWIPVPNTNSIFTNSICHAVAWDGDQWLAGFSGTGPYKLGNSGDGFKWSGNASASSLLTIGCFALASNGSLWLAGGSGSSRLIYSADGDVWANVTGSPFGDGVCLAIGWNGSLWVAGSSAASNRLAYSADGSANWIGSTSGNALFTTSCKSVGWNGRIWVAVGSSAASGVIATSTNGQTWTVAATVPATTIWNSVAWNGTIWVLGGTGTTTLAYSYDGNVWLVPQTTVFTSSCRSVAWNGTLWIATGSGTNTAAYSYNGITWTPANSINVSAGHSVGVNRAFDETGPMNPPPAFYPTTSTVGGAVYSTGFTNLYTSSTLFINDASGAVGLNRTPVPHTAITGRTLQPNIDISGEGIWIATSNVTGPSINLENKRTGTGYAGRILMQNTPGNYGWSIDSLSDNTTGPNLVNDMRFVRWTGTSSNVVMDFNNGYVGIGGVPNQNNEGLMLDVFGSARVSNNLFVTNSVLARDVSATNIFISNDAKLTDVSATTIQVSGRSILTDVSATNLTVSNDVQLTDLSANNIQVSGRSILTDISATNLSVSNDTLLTDVSATTIQVSGRSILTDVSATNLSVSNDTRLVDVSATNVQVSGLLTLVDLFATNLTVLNDTQLTDVSASILQLSSRAILQDVSANNITAITRISAPTISATTSVSAPTITGTTSVSAPTITGTTSVSAPTITGTTSISTPNLTVSNDTLLTDVSASILQLSSRARLQDVSANNITATGPIFSTLALTSRAAFYQTYNTSTSTSTQLNYSFTNTYGYSIFLVTIMFVIIPVNDAAAPYDYLEMTINGADQDYIGPLNINPAQATGIGANTIVIPYTNVVATQSNTITIIAKLLRADGILTGSSFFSITGAAGQGNNRITYVGLA